MPLAERFEELIIWQDARRLNLQVYKTLSDSREWFFRDQMYRASLSVMNNIAEGFERKTPKDFARFLDIAKGSSGEVRSMCYAGEDMQILTTDSAETLRQEYELLSKRISTFRNKLNV